MIIKIFLHTALVSTRSCTHIDFFFNIEGIAKRMRYFLENLLDNFAYTKKSTTPDFNSFDF